MPKSGFNLSDDPVRDLIANSDWVHRLARRLVADPHLADDLAQSTCVAAIEQPPASGGVGRAWLATVLRNLLHQHLRREGDRSRRERRAASPEPLPSTTESLARVHIQREVAEAVAVLDEPYRSAILWRYFDDLPPREIAKRQGVPLATIKSQLQRALSQLRSRLISGDTDRGKSWVAALGLLTRSRGNRSVGSVFATWISGAIVMKTNVVSIAAIVCVIAAASWEVWRRSAAATALEEIGGPTAQGIGVSGVQHLDPEDEVIPTRSELAPAMSRVGETNTLRPTFRGRVFDSVGSPIGDVTLRGFPGQDDVETTSAPDGSFQFPIADHAQEIRAHGGDWATLIAGQVAAGGPVGHLEPIIVLAPGIGLAGRIVDSFGAPVRGATIRFSLPPNFADRFVVSLDATRSAYRDWQSESDDRGRFAMPKIAAIPGASLRVRARDHLPSRFDVPSQSRSDLRLVIEKPPSSDVKVLGQVVGTHGEPVVGARVGMLDHGTVSGLEGRFEIVLGDQVLEGPLPITALMRGFLPARTEVEAPSINNPPPFVFLYLGEEPLSIQGRVVDRSGRPVSGVRVWARDSELAEGLGGSVEGFLAGGATRSLLRERLAASPHLAEDADELGTIQPTADWGWVRTGRGGVFDLGGLQNKSYQLGVMQEEALQVATAGPYVAGTTGVEILFAPDVYAEVGGRIVGLDGMPVEGVTVDVTAWSDLGEKRRRRDGKSYQNVEAVRGPRRKTDVDGHFLVRGLGKQPFFLTVFGDHIMNRNFGLSEHGLHNVSPVRPMEDLLLVVERRFHLRLDLGADIADRFRVVDAVGEPLSIVLFDGGGRNSSGSRPIVEGRTRVYAIGEGAVAVLLLKGGEEVQHIPIFLEAGDVNVVRR